MRERINQMRQKAAQCGVTKSNVAVVWIVGVMLMSLVAGVTSAQETDEPATITVTAYDETGAEVGTVTINRSPSLDGKHLAYTVLGENENTNQYGYWDNVTYLNGEMIESFEDNDISGYQIDGRENEWIVTSNASTDGDYALRGQGAGSRTILYNPNRNVTSSFSTDIRSEGTSPDNQFPTRTGVYALYNTSTNDGYLISANPITGELVLSGYGDSDSTNIGYGLQEWYTLEVEMTGEGITQPPYPDPSLTLHHNNYMKHGETQPYTVTYENGTGSHNVTSEANVWSNNTSVVTFDTSAISMTATGDTSINARVKTHANYTTAGGTVVNDTSYVTVANVSVSNLEILPPIYRFSASVGDDTLFWAIISMLGAIVFTRLSTAFGGICAYVLSFMMGWFSGYVPFGIMLMVVMTGAFLGLNLAANINYGAVGNAPGMGRLE